MSRVHFRGGPWTNAEDQVLKAALARYGLRDWERVASMLTQKTAAQCRDRWENYLDPRLHLKEAWSPDEEEKLVELQSLFPNQWRLISEQLTKSTPAKYIRPAWLCEQHYLEIRDAHEYEKQRQQQQQQPQKDEHGEPIPPQTLEEFMRERRQRRVAYQSHEEKAARADTVDGSHYEEEMLTMAVSRLANQDQKKGLRKERERKLEEARFLAKLESNRESIESGTLSARQEKLMRKALEEDRRHLKRLREGAEDDSDKGGDEGSEDKDDDADDDDDKGFHPMDVLEDKEQAGAQKRARTLIMDLGAQQEKITASSSASSSAAAGVNASLLDQLTAGPGPLAIGAGAGGAAVKAVLNTSSGGSGGSATTWEALAGPSAAAPNLDDLFASLPEVTASPSSSSGKHKSKRTTAPPNTAPKESASPQMPNDPSLLAAGEVSLSIPAPLPEKHISRQSSDWAALWSEGPASTTDTATATAASAPFALDSVAELLRQEVPPSATLLASPAAAASEARAASPLPPHKLPTHERVVRVDDAYVTTAKELVAVETEKLVLRARRLNTSQTPPEDDSDADDDSVVTAEDVALVKCMLEEALRAASANAWPEKDGSAPTAAVSAAHAAHVSTTHATRALQDDCAKQLAKVNAQLATVEKRVGDVALSAFLDPNDHLVRPYVTAASVLPEPTLQAVLLPYVKRRWEATAQAAQQEAAFLAALRVREQQAMARRLDEAQHTLEALKTRESHLQAMYRQRAQDSARS